uniref:Reverse transcriptase domain-containing protein n=1 Tax=Panagrellus redivivus TaxID=6233 RepID=A0A7E4W4S9_PANRE
MAREEAKHVCVASIWTNGHNEKYSMKTDEYYAYSWNQNGEKTRKITPSTPEYRSMMSLATRKRHSNSQSVS